MAKKSRKYVEAAKLIDRTQRYALEEAVELVKKTSITKFDGTVEVAFNMNLDPRKAEQNLRGAIVLPYGSGKTRSVLVLTKSAEKQKEAEAAGADFVGDAEYLDKIKGGWFGFDIIVATPDMMGELGKLGKIEYRVDKAGNIQVIAGKVSFDSEKIVENIKTVYNTLLKIKPSTVKGAYIKNMAIATTMGPGVKVSLESL